MKTFFFLLLLATPAWAVPITEHPVVTVRAEITIHEPVTEFVPVAELMAPIWRADFGPDVTVLYYGDDPGPPMEHAPEPATILLVGSSLVALGWRVRRGR